ncbi:hypothetical protein [Accumulibacter sp.]|uniref:Uncharacterized protein n=1 Tax=Candidatus Accumulibacter proximus TaxID=2954385 RepID=A0A935PYH5_9PROT|nr:hypothetical protein [Accumulibacter sp.]MBK7675708.1 hypothetical protein [Candidatus Accumulibacter proximus]MBL8375894.1 hypothetical protein [Accumulibacter sp.]
MFLASVHGREGEVANGRFGAFGSNSLLRALAEVYACSDAQEAFMRGFVAA